MVSSSVEQSDYDNRSHNNSNNNTDTKIPFLKSEVNFEDSNLKMIDRISVDQATLSASEQLVSSSDNNLNNNITNTVSELSSSPQQKQKNSKSINGLFVGILNYDSKQQQSEITVDISIDEKVNNVNKETTTETTSRQDRTTTIDVLIEVNEPVSRSSQQQQKKPKFRCEELDGVKPDSSTRSAPIASPAIEMNREDIDNKPSGETESSGGVKVAVPAKQTVESFGTSSVPVSARVKMFEKDIKKETHERTNSKNYNSSNPKQYSNSYTFGKQTITADTAINKPC